MPNKFLLVIYFLLRWEFMTEEKDIDFRIYFEDIVQQTNTEVIEKIRVDSSLMIEEGEIICPWQGTCNSLGL